MGANQSADLKMNPSTILYSNDLDNSKSNTLCKNDIVNHLIPVVEDVHQYNIENSIIFNRLNNEQSKVTLISWSSGYSFVFLLKTEDNDDLILKIIPIGKHYIGYITEEMADENDTSNHVLKESTSKENFVNEFQVMLSIYKCNPRICPKVIETLYSYDNATKYSNTELLKLLFERMDNVEKEKSRYYVKWLENRQVKCFGVIAMEYIEPIDCKIKIDEKKQGVNILAAIILTFVQFKILHPDLTNNNRITNCESNTTIIDWGSLLFIKNNTNTNTNTPNIFIVDQKGNNVNVAGLSIDSGSIESARVLPIITTGTKYTITEKLSWVDRYKYSTRESSGTLDKYLNSLFKTEIADNLLYSMLFFNETKVIDLIITDTSTQNEINEIVLFIKQILYFISRMDYSLHRRNLFNIGLQLHIMDITGGILNVMHDQPYDDTHLNSLLIEVSYEIGRLYNGYSSNKRKTNIGSLINNLPRRTPVKLKRRLGGNRRKTKNNRRKIPTP